MYIKKIGHCCLVIKDKGLTILTDPGSFSTAQDSLTGIDVVLITHEHQDHLHIDSLKKVLANNPQAKVISNASVGKILDKENIAYKIVGDGQQTTVGEILFEGMGTKHAIVYKDIGQVENTGYFINKKLFYPGDALYDPKRPVDILALPVAGPWVKFSEFIEYALAVKPKHAFPVHDAVLSNLGIGLSQRMPNLIFDEKGIAFHPLNAGDEIEL